MVSLAKMSINPAGRLLKVPSFCQLILSILNSKSKVIYNQLPEDDPLKRKPDLTLAKKILNWSPKVNNKDGFRMLIEYYKKNNLI